jgi:hypothetical protein
MARRWFLPPESCLLSLVSSLLLEMAFGLQPQAEATGPRREKMNSSIKCSIGDHDSNIAVVPCTYFASM